jgi:CHAD domain-containing protein
MNASRGTIVSWGVSSTGYVATLRKSISQNRRKLLKCEPKVLRGKLEPIHDYRVDLRRIRSGLRLIADAGQGDKVDKLRKRGGAFARSTGHLRDLDVFLKQAKADMAEGLAPEAWSLSLARERSDALEAAREVLTGKKYERWKSKLETWLEEDFDDLPIADGLSAAIRSHIDSIHEHETAGTDEEYHALRIAVKRLRYLLEFFEDSLPCESQMAIGRLASIQDVLGRHHDLAVAVEMLDKAISVVADLDVVGQLKAYKAVLGKQKRRLRPSKAVAEVLEITRLLAKR